MTPEHPDHDADRELDALLDGIYRRHHHDFRGYARVFLRRRIAQAQASLGCPTVRRLHDRVLRDPDALATMLRYFMIHVSDLYRDPGYYCSLRTRVMSHLATYPVVRVWVAGCGTGEEAYSLAIALEEHGLLDRSLVYATDIDTDSLRTAEAGSYEKSRMRKFGENYLLAGGTASLSDYYSAVGPHAVFHPALRKRILFSEHSLATDAAFAEVHLVSCRNVLIYFDRELRDRVIGLFRASLCSRGFLGLGAGETVMMSAHATAFEAFAEPERLYRMR